MIFRTDYQRAEEIALAFGYMYECMLEEVKATNYNDRHNWLWGFMDWHEELHRLLHEFDKTT